MIRCAVAGFLAAMAILLFADGAAADPHLDGQFPVTGVPGQVTEGPDGNVWFTLADSTDGKEFGRITPEGTVTEYDTPNDLPVTAISAGPTRGSGPNPGPITQVWMSQVNGMVQWDPSSATGTVYELPAIWGAPGMPDPKDLALDGTNLLVADGAKGLLQFNPRILSLVAPSFAMNVPATSVAVAGDRFWWGTEDGYVWDAYYDNNDVPNDPDWVVGQTKAEGVPVDLAGGAGNPWSIEGLGMMAYTASGDPQGAAAMVDQYEFKPKYAGAGVDDPVGVAAGPDDGYWVAEGEGDRLGQLAPSGRYYGGLDLPAGSNPGYLAEGSDGNLWVGLRGTREIARVAGIPASPAIPQMTGLRVAVKGRKAVVHMKLNVAGTVKVWLKRGLKHRRFKLVRKLVVRKPAGNNSIVLGKRLPRGKFKATVRYQAPIGSWGVSTGTWNDSRGFKVRR